MARKRATDLSKTDMTMLVLIVLLVIFGLAVLLSPACGSWGMFDNYEQRGDMFKEYVRAMCEK